MIVHSLSTFKFRDKLKIDRYTYRYKYRRLKFKHTKISIYQIGPNRRQKQDLNEASV
jgi:hypothetical protein